jgi:hypothetical protein
MADDPLLDRLLQQAKPADDPLLTKLQPPAAPEQPESWNDYFSGLAGKYMQGATFGFGDEIKGAIEGGKAKLLRGEDYGPAYEKGRDEARATLEQFRQRHPVQSLAANVGGGAGTALVGGAIPAVSRGVQLAGRLVPAAADIPLVGSALEAAPAWLRTAAGWAGAGAVGGGAQGFGEGEGGVVPRLQEAGKGAALGGALGIPVALGAKAIGEGVKTVGRALGFFNPENVAKNLQLRNFERDNITPATVADRMNAPEYVGAPMIVPDVAGRNTVNLGSSVANMPGRGMDVAEQVAKERRAGGPERMQEAARREFGGGFGDARDPRLTLEMERGTNAPPLYEQSYQEGINPTALPRAAEFMADPIGQEALQRGLRTIELEHLARGEPFMPELYGVRRATPQESGNAPQPYTRPAGMSPSPAAVEAGADPSNPVQVAGRWVIPENSTPNMRLLDAVKQGYDDIVGQLRDPRTGIVQSDRYIRAVDDSRRAFRDHLAEANPTYGEALQAWSGPSSSREALRLGQEAFGKSTNDIVATNTGKLDPADAPFYRIGSGHSYGSKFTDPRDVPNNARKFREDIGIQDKLGDILPGEGRDRLNRELEREMRIGQVNNAINPNAGSHTQRLAAVAEDTAGGANALGEALHTGVTVGPGAAAMKLLQQALNRGRGLTPEVGELLANRLFTTDRGAIQANMADLTRHQQAKELDAQIRQQLANRLLFGTGAQAEQQRPR